MFPHLRSTTPVLRRGDGEIQIGLDPDTAVVLTGLSTAEIRELEHLDGTRDLRTLARLRGAVRGDLLVAIVRQLAAAGVVDDAQAVASPAVRRVLIDGQGATAQTLSLLLRRMGVEVVTGRGALDAVDLDTRSGHAATPVDLVVPVALGGLSPEHRFLTRDLPCLPVVVCTHSIVVGPFVDGTGVCLRCLDLTRADRDPAWAHMLAQMGRLAEPDAPTPLSGLAAAAAASAVSARLVAPHAPDLREESVEVSLDPLRLVRRRWAVHPRCPHHGAEQVA